MKVTFDLLFQDIRRIGRALLGPLPGYPDSTEAQGQALNEEEQKRGGPIHDQWIEYHYGDHIAYTLYKGTGAGGITRRQLPQGVDPQSVIRIDVPSTDRPVTRKLEELWALVERLKADERTLIEGSGEGIEFVGSDEERTKLATLADWIGLIRTVSDPDFHGKALQRYAARFKQALPTDPSATDATSYFQTVHLVRDEIMGLHQNLGVDSLLAAWFLVYDDVCQGIYEQGVQRGFTEQQHFAVMLKLAEFGCIPSASGPGSLIDTLSFGVGTMGFHALMAELAERYLEEAQKLLKKAIESNSKDEHGQWIYQASVWFMAAHRIFEGLLEQEITGLSPETRTLYIGINKGAEEETVRVAHALLFAFQDRFGEKEEAFAHDLKAIKRSGGQQAMENMLYQWIDVQYFYPRFYGKQLILRSEQI